MGRLRTRAEGVLGANLTEKCHATKGNADVREVLGPAHTGAFEELPFAASRKFVGASTGHVSIDRFP